MARWTTRLVATAALVLGLVALAGCASVGSPLDGTRWRLVGWSMSSIDPATVTITAEFAGGEISGNSGVNSYSGSYKAGSGGAFSVGPLAGTLIAGPEPAMSAESAYLALLGQAKSYRLEAGTLTLLDAGGSESLVFEAAEN